MHRRPGRRQYLWWPCLLFLFVSSVAVLWHKGDAGGELEGPGRRLLQAASGSKIANATDVNATSTATLEAASSDSGNPLYPPDLFTDEQIRNGAFILYLMGIFYTFFALAIVCDDYFVPALEVIIDTLGLSEDVAGATFMAAGGSAPELFTSFLGEFVAKSNVGFGTIIGSAVFNVMFVIGACAVATLSLYPEGIPLTWWPLFRDSAFYAVDLGLLTYFYSDKNIEWYESLCLLGMYGLYVLFMSRSESIQEYIEGFVNTQGRTKENKKASFASMGIPGELTESLSPKSAPPVIDDQEMQSMLLMDESAELAKTLSVVSTRSSSSEEEDGTWEPKMPEGAWEKVKFITLFPINVLLWLTVPNCAIEEKKRYFVVAFLLSILWIAVYSYFMVWWAEVLGRALEIPIEVMGYTLLAAGTSVPDLITSVLVARLGRGDMAVSSSIGSNIFDITLGLPLPWFLRSITSSGSPVHVESTSLGPSVGMLILMLISVIASIAVFGWRLDKRLGIICFGLYVVFVTLSLLLEYEVITVF
eukprot:TRINITY_DN745_c0_g1_i3.p1 TRINITY_DN745_c0_g1~~TRINITY_DN745_c0_g1_i3.p1  ORF type:complete len:531 (+),score=103.68 TRINITY_DN745_c0_g1_i3:69-1661(+)